MHQSDLEHILSLHTDSGIPDQLRAISDAFPGKCVFSSSFSWEDQLISHYIFSNNLNIEVFTLDTGRLFPETYSTWSRTIEKYNKKIIAYYPNASRCRILLLKKDLIVFMNLLTTGSNAALSEKWNPCNVH